MSQSMIQPPVPPSVPITDEPNNWDTYRSEWNNYCNLWRAFYKKEQYKESDIDGWQVYYNAWSAHWKRLGQQWRTEPEIDNDRQKELTGYHILSSNIQQDKYPFSAVRLNRADVEWMLTNFTGRLQQGLDIRGAEMRGIDLRGLPLAHLRGGLTLDEWNIATAEQRKSAGINLEEAILEEVHLEKAMTPSR